MAKARTRMTAEDLLRLPDGGVRRELLRGELREMSPAGGRHGTVAATMIVLLGQHVREQRLGVVLAAETGFRISRDPDTVRAPDASFVARERIPPGGPPEGFWELVPDQAVEVVSPHAAAAEVQAKVLMWLESGTRLVWVVYPDTRSVMVHESPRAIRTLSAEDVLEGGEVVPAFSCPVSEVFA